jgi:hypothetical protein
MKPPRVIIYAKPEEMILAARMAARLSAPNYHWPTDGWALTEYENDTSFAARRNKTGFTIYSQQLGAPASAVSQIVADVRGAGK